MKYTFHPKKIFLNKSDVAEKQSGAVFKLANRAEYSFNAFVTDEGSIYLPDDILEKLNLEEEINVWIIPNKKAKETTTIQTDDFDIKFVVLRNKMQIYNKLKNTVAIDDDYLFLLEFYTTAVFKKHKFINMPKFLATLMTLYGEPDTFYDDFKCSFNYTFDFRIVYKNENPAREVNLTMRINDLKGGFRIEFRRLRESSSDDILKLIEDVVKREDLNKSIMLLHSYFSGFYYGYGTRYFEKYEKYQPYCNARYGYDGNNFYYIEEKEEPE